MATSNRSVIRLLLVLPFLLLSANVFCTERPVIAIVKSRDIEPYNVALRGFNKAMEDNSINPSIIEYNLDGSEAKSATVTKEIGTLNPAFILTVGTLATDVIKKNIKDTPVIFCMVLNPVAGGLIKSKESSGNNLTGSCMDISPEYQFEVLKTVLPNMKSVGVLYNPKETSMVISEAMAAAQKVGLRVVAKKVSSESEVPSSLDEVGKKVDCLWAISDSTVFSSVKSIQSTILYTLHNKIPFMGLSSTFVKSGALIAISCDVEDNGYQAGEIAKQLIAGAAPTDIPIATPRKRYLSINLKIAEHIGKKIPSDVLSEAKEVFE